MAQIVSPLFLPPEGFAGAASVRINSLGVFLNLIEDDISNVFIPEGQVDFAQNIYYTHSTDRDSVQYTYPCLDDTKTIQQDVGNGSGYFTNELAYVQMRTKSFNHEVNRDDVAILNGIKYTVDSYEESYGITMLYLKEFTD